MAHHKQGRHKTRFCDTLISFAGANSSVSVELVKPQKPFAELFLHPLKVFATPTSMPLVCKARAASTASSATLVPSAAAAVNAGPQVAAAAAGALYDAGPAAPRWNPLLACGVCRHVLVKKPTRKKLIDSRCKY